MFNKWLGNRKLKNSTYFCQKLFPLKDLLLITPPFTQLNTPYPATAYLKGFLNTKNISSIQMDLGIDAEISIPEDLITDKTIVAFLRPECETGSHHAREIALPAGPPESHPGPPADPTSASADCDA